MQREIQLLGDRRGLLAGQKRYAMPAAGQFAAHCADRQQVPRIIGAEQSVVCHRCMFAPTGPIVQHSLPAITDRRVSRRPEHAAKIHEPSALRIEIALGRNRLHEDLAAFRLVDLNYDVVDFADPGLDLGREECRRRRRC